MNKIDNKYKQIFVGIILDNVYDIKNLSDEAVNNATKLAYRNVDLLINFVSNSTYFTRYKNEFIEGNTLCKIHNLYVKCGVYSDLNKKMLELYFSNNCKEKLLYTSTDTTFIPNKFGTELIECNTHYYNKNGFKILTITDKYGVAVLLMIVPGGKNDAVSFVNMYDNIIKNPILTKNKCFFLANKGFDSTKIRDLLKNIKYTPIIPYNKRNTKEENRKHLTDEEKKHYKNRSTCEHTNAWIKAFPVLSFIYEKTTDSYMGLLLLANSMTTYKKWKKMSKPLSKIEKTKRQIKLEYNRKKKKKTIEEIIALSFDFGTALIEVLLWI